LGYWQERLKRMNINTGEIVTRFGADVLTFTDPDGLVLELIASDAPATLRHWQDGPIPKAHALRGFHSVTLWLNEVERTGALLT
jgi:glyoxalase family protein